MQLTNSQILVNDGERKALKEAFNCTYPTVRTALKGISKTALAYKIRVLAIERGGVEIIQPKK